MNPRQACCHRFSPAASTDAAKAMRSLALRGEKNRAASEGLLYTPLTKIYRHRAPRGLLAGGLTTEITCDEKACFARCLFDLACCVFSCDCSESPGDLGDDSRYGL